MKIVILKISKSISGNTLCRRNIGKGKLPVCFFQGHGNSRQIFAVKGCYPSANGAKLDFCRFCGLPGFSPGIRQLINVMPKPAMARTAHAVIITILYFEGSPAHAQKCSRMAVDEKI